MDNQWNGRKTLIGFESRRFLEKINSCRLGIGIPASAFCRKGGPQSLPRFPACWNVQTG